MIWHGMAWYTHLGDSNCGIERIAGVSHFLSFQRFMHGIAEFNLTGMRQSSREYARYTMYLPGSVSVASLRWSTGPRALLPLLRRLEVQ